MNTIDPRKHASVRKPLVGIRAVSRMLLRSVDASCPEARLIVAMIAQAMEDCASKVYVDQLQAERFMRSWRLEVWATAVGLDPGFVREVAIKTQYLSPTEPVTHALRPKVTTNRANTQEKHQSRRADA